VICDDPLLHRSEARPTVARNVLEVQGRLVFSPTELYKWLGCYNYRWQDGTGVLTSKELYAFPYYLQQAEEAAAEAEQRSVKVGQDAPHATQGEEEGEGSHYALRAPKAF